MRSRGRRVAGLALLLIAAGIAHRLTLFLLYGDDLDRLIDANPDTLTWQLPTRLSLLEHMARTLFSWQQTPPIPPLLFGIAVKLFTWPHGTAYACIALHGALSIASATLLFLLLERLTGWTALGFSVSALYLASVDLVVMEYNAFGQTFYDALSAVLLLAAVLAFLRLRERGRLADAVSLALACALLALSRSPFWAWFLLPLALWPAAPRPGARRRALAFLAVLAALQGGWVAKNLALYGRLQPSGSSWVGSNFAHGLSAAGHGEAFRAFLLGEGQRHPKWFRRLVRHRGVDGFPYEWERWPRAAVPPWIRRADARSDARLSGTSRGSNSVAQAETSARFLAGYLRFAASQPGIVARKLRDSYLLFWQPVRNYSIQFVDPLYVVPVVENAFRPREVWRALREGGLPEAERIMVGPNLGHPKRSRATRIPAASLLPLALLLLEVAVLHLLSPLALGVVAWRWRSGRGGGARERVFLLLGGSFLYAALVLNLAEHGENMRFRSTVEPLLLALAVLDLRILADTLRGPSRSLS